MIVMQARVISHGRVMDRRVCSNLLLLMVEAMQVDIVLPQKCMVYGGRTRCYSSETGCFFKHEFKRWMPFTL